MDAIEFGPLSARCSGKPVGAEVIGVDLAQALFPNLLSVMTYIKSGKLVPLAVSSPRRTALIPQLPTIAESGLAGYAVAQGAGS